MPTPDISRYTDAADVLAAEQDHLRRSRADLRAMRERTLSLTAQAGDAVSEAYLQASLYRRAKALEDETDVPLFFGRIDTTGDGTEHGPETFHIGRRHVMDSGGEPVVIDWRADVSRAFYRATRTDPQGVRLRRRFGYARGVITSYEDEHLLDTTEHDSASRILADEIERPRVGPMRDIVATIQPEQDEVVRADLRQTVCVQGGPGTGKTAVGLHRAAYLLHAHRDQLSRRGVLVVGPNSAFLHYIGQVLPALGEVDVRQVTIDELTAMGPVRTRDDADVATLKGDARMAELLRRGLWSHINEPAEALVVPRGAHKWRVPAHEIRDEIDALRVRGDGYETCRTLLPQRLAHLVLLRIEGLGGVTDDRVQHAVARSRPVRDFADSIWPAVDAGRLVFRLLTDADFLAEHAGGLLDEAEQRLLLWPKAVRSPRTAPWSVPDAVLVDEAAALLERTPGVGHVVLDEAQDLSPMQLRAVGRRAALGSATVLGDIAQGTTPWATPSWPVALAHLAQDGAHIEELQKGYRVPAEVIAFAGRLLPHIAQGVAAPAPVRSNPGRLDLVHVDEADLLSGAATAAATALAREGSVGVISADVALDRVMSTLDSAGLTPRALSDEADSRLTVVPASMAKGLEFDHVVVVEPAAVVAAEADERTGLRRLYVVLTRAVTSLAVVHARALPDALVV